MRATHGIFWFSSFVLALITATAAWAQAYPSKPVRIFTTGAGSGSDFIARLIAQQISPALGQPVIIDNRSGPGSIGGEIVSKSTPDGHTLLIAGGSFYSVTLLQKMPYDTLRDFAPITLIDRQPLFVFVHPSLPVASIKELIALARARPGEINFSSGGIGSSGHLAAELFKAMTGANIVHISYKGNSQALLDLLSGNVPLTFNSASGVMPQVKLGKLRVLAVTSEKPSALAPDVPPVAATVPGYETVSMTGMWAPAQTPAAIINRLNQEVVRVLRAPETKEKMLTTSGTEAVGNSPDEFAAKLKADLGTLGKLIRDLGIGAK